MRVYETDQRGVDRVASRVDGNSQSHDIGRSGVGDAAYLVMSRLPSVLQHSVMLSNGIGYLANNSIKVDMHLARHAGHNDFGAPGVHESLVRGGYPVIGIEGVWWKAADQELLDRYRAGKASLHDIMQRFDATALRTILAAKGAGRIVLTDIQSPHESQASRELYKMRQAMECLSAHADEAQIERWAYYQHLREWCALGMLGVRMAEMGADRSLLVFGGGHKALPVKLKRLGVKVQNVSEMQPLHPVTKIVTDRILQMSRDEK